MAESPKRSQPVTLDALSNQKLTISVQTAELRDERISRLRREEAKDAYERRIGLIVHIFVIAVVAVAFLICGLIVLLKDPKTGLPDKALGIIAAIVAAGVGYLTGKASKQLS